MEPRIAPEIVKHRIYLHPDHPEAAVVDDLIERGTARSRSPKRNNPRYEMGNASLARDITCGSSILVLPVLMRETLWSNAGCSKMYRNGFTRGNDSRVPIREIQSGIRQDPGSAGTAFAYPGRTVAMMTSTARERSLTDQSLVSSGFHPGFVLLKKSRGACRASPIKDRNSTQFSLPGAHNSL
jgi:hypothetical protein